MGGIMDAFKGGFVSLGSEIQSIFSNHGLSDSQQSEALKGQSGNGFSIDWYSKTLIAVGVVVLGAVAISKAMK